MPVRHSSSQPPPTFSPPLEYLRHTEFSRLDQQNQTYLDYTGSALYPSSILDNHQTLLRQHTYGNPHSQNPTSDAATKLVEDARHQVLSFFRADPNRYTVIFTSNASTAIKLVAESFPFSPNSQLLLLSDNHNSVNGIRQYATNANSKISYVPLTSNLRINQQILHTSFNDRKKGTSCLFAYPAQSNFSGVQHSLSHVATARTTGWFTLLDCAAYAPTSRLDLSTVRPDFVPISFYKMFGYPTGVGALIARKSSLQKLKRPWFAGGTVAAASVMANAHTLSDLPTAFEDGTVDFLSIAAVPIGLKFLNQLTMVKVHSHVLILTQQLLKGLLDLRHSSGRSIVRIHGPKDMNARGGTVALDLLAQDGNLIDPGLVDRAAGKMGISLRVGCFCNPGAAEFARGVDPGKFKTCVKEFGVEKCVRMEQTAAVRVSLGIANNRADIEKVLKFFKDFARSQLKGSCCEIDIPDCENVQQTQVNVPQQTHTHAGNGRKRESRVRTERYHRHRHVIFDLKA